MLARNPCGRQPVVHLFSKAGRGWLSELDLPLDEQLTLEGWLRQIDFLDQELRALEGVLARQALASAEIWRLMTIPGVNAHTATPLDPPRRGGPGTATRGVKLGGAGRGRIDRRVTRCG